MTHWSAVFHRRTLPVPIDELHRRRVVIGTLASVVSEIVGRLIGAFG